MRRPWTAVRVLFHSHRWDAVEIDGDAGWKCRVCDAIVLEREYLERVHDPDEATEQPKDLAVRLLRVKAPPPGPLRAF
jgi:hypothetical protein